MEATADGRALEAFIKRQIAASAEIHSLLQLSRATGIRASTMYEWFSGLRAPRTDSLARIAAAFGLSASRLLDAYQGHESVEVNDAALAAIERVVQQAVQAAIERLIDDGVLALPVDRR